MARCQQELIDSDLIFIYSTEEKILDDLAENLNEISKQKPVIRVVVVVKSAERDWASNQSVTRTPG